MHRYIRNHNAVLQNQNDIPRVSIFFGGPSSIIGLKKFLFFLQKLMVIYVYFYGLCLKTEWILKKVKNYKYFELSDTSMLA